jgi:integral membrane protein
LTQPNSFLQSPEYRQLHLAGLAEGISFLVLLGIAMPLKYLAGMPQAVRIVGSLHGALFLAYLITVYFAASTWKWHSQRIMQGLIAAVVPLGPFWFDAKLKREG